MSCFVISKNEYIKAAAFCAAAAETKKPHEKLLWIWNEQNGRTSTAEDIRADFVRLYEINAAAVVDRYDETMAENDPENYDNEWAETWRTAYALIGRSRYNTGDRLRALATVYALVGFLDSVRYQIYGEENARDADKILNQYYRELHTLARHLSGVGDKTGHCWGEFNIAPEI